MLAEHHHFQTCYARRWKQRYFAGPSLALACLLTITACSPSQDVLGDGEQRNTSAPKSQAALTIGPLEEKAHADAVATAGEAKKLAELKARVTSAMEKVLFDPGSMQLRDLRSGRNGAICGKVNAKNRYGAYVGYKDFVVAKDGWPEISSFNDGVRSALYGSFADAYVADCASGSERKVHAAATAPTYSYDSSAASLGDAADNLLHADEAPEDPFAE